METYTLRFNFERPGYNPLYEESREFSESQFPVWLKAFRMMVGPVCIIRQSDGICLMEREMGLV